MNTVVELLIVNRLHSQTVVSLLAVLLDADALLTMKELVVVAVVQIHAHVKAVIGRVLVADGVFISTSITRDIVRASVELFLDLLELLLGRLAVTNDGTHVNVVNTVDAVESSLVQLA